ncbi:MAG: glycosyltransferase family 39 protein [Actinobacteria bacterium]|nr:MAG: glycosyltransferase family 39 protein [Actinomycetota bacterium]
MSFLWETDSARSPATPVARPVSWQGLSLTRAKVLISRLPRPELLALLGLAAALDLWALSRNGWANDYYSAAARSMSSSWHNFLFASMDPSGVMTVDKPPLSLWVIGLSARVFGFSSLSLLLPQALETIAAVGLLYLTVRRLFGPAAAIAAAAALAITPVTVAVARVNNPDALLVLLLVASAYLLVRALESGRTRTLVGCGALVGLAFMTKMLQGWMVVPAAAARAWPGARRGPRDGGRRRSVAVAHRTDSRLPAPVGLGHERQQRPVADPRLQRAEPCRRPGRCAHGRGREHVRRYAGTAAAAQLGTRRAGRVAARIRARQLRRHARREPPAPLG